MTKDQIQANKPDGANHLDNKGDFVTAIELCGGQGPAEMIASLCLTNAPCPEGYFPQLKKYFSVLDGMVYIYYEKQHQYLEYMNLEKVYFNYVWIKELRDELKNLQPL